jgi:hypothetical protein
MTGFASQLQRPRVLTTLLLIALLGCSKGPGAPVLPTAAVHSERAVADRARLSQVIAIQNRHTARLLQIPGVVGVGTGIGRDGQPAIEVFVGPSTLTDVPTDIDGVPVEMVGTGDYEAWGTMSRYRPLAIGISLDNDQQCSFGTLGCIVTRGSHTYALSCNHVLARQNQALIGERVVQPARIDNRPTCADRGVLDQVATLTDFEPLRFDGRDNVMDAAIAELSVPATCSTLPQYYGAPGPTIINATLGLPVQKVGRTTNLTTGTVTAINATFDVTYSGGTARFVGVIVTSNGFGKPGDSGSLMVTNDGRNNPVGILFGGDNHGSGIVIPIGPVLDRFNVSLCRP